VTARLAAANQDTVLVALGDLAQAAQIGGVRVDGKDTGNYFDTTLAAGFLVQLAKLIDNPTTTLAKTDDQ
jgi:hypothetical protein